MVSLGQEVPSMFGIPLHLSPLAPDGMLIRIGNEMFIGFATESDDAHTARSIVRAGLRDELRWLKLPTMTGRETYEALKRKHENL